MALCCNNESTTTRIETLSNLCLLDHLMGCNNESTTTRIETITIDWVWYHFLCCNNESTTTRIETIEYHVVSETETELQ